MYYFFGYYSVIYTIKKEVGRQLLAQPSTSMKKKDNSSHLESILAGYYYVIPNKKLN